MVKKFFLFLLFLLFLIPFSSAVCTTTHPRLTENYTITFEEKANFSDIYDPHYNLLNGRWRLNYYNATNLTFYDYTNNFTYEITYVEEVSEFFPNNESINITSMTINYQRTFSPLDNLDDVQSICTICNSLVALEEYDFYVAWKSNSTEECSSAACDKPLNKSLMSTIIFIFLLAMLVFVGFSLYSGASGKAIIGIGVAFLILLVALLLISQITQSICVVVG